MPPLPSPLFSRKKIHERICVDPWSIGLVVLKEEDVLYNRAEVARCLQKKSSVRKCILNGIGSKLSKESVASIGC